MAKGQLRSNREAKKPKQDKAAKVPVSPFAVSTTKSTAVPAAPKKK